MKRLLISSLSSSSSLLLLFLLVLLLLLYEKCTAYFTCYNGTCEMLHRQQTELNLVYWSHLMNPAKTSSISKHGWFSHVFLFQSRWNLCASTHNYPQLLLFSRIISSLITTCLYFNSNDHSSFYIFVCHTVLPINFFVHLKHVQLLISSRMIDPRYYNWHGIWNAFMVTRFCLWKIPCLINL